MGQLCTIKSGESDTKDAIEDGPYAFFDRSRKIKRSSRYLYDLEALIIPGEGTEFLPRHFIGKFDLHQRAYALFNFSPRIEPKFLYYYLHHMRNYFPCVAVGATVKSLRLRHFQELPVSITSVPDQRRIVTILDKAFAAIATAKANTERNLQNARALFDSELQSLFAPNGHAWPKKTLAEVSREFGRGKSKHRPRNDPKLYGGSYPFIQTGDVRTASHLITSYSQTYNEAGLAQSKLWPAGTLCITIAANIAETGVLAFDACFPDSIIGLVADECGASSAFLEYMLQNFKTHLQAQGKGSAQDNINMGTFENQHFPIPPLPMQRRIVLLLDNVQAEVETLDQFYRKRIAALDELKKSLLQEAFHGRL